jgi:hypothetical protein
LKRIKIISGFVGSTRSAEKNVTKHIYLRKMIIAFEWFFLLKKSVNIHSSNDNNQILQWMNFKNFALALRSKPTKLVLISNDTLCWMPVMIVVFVCLWRVKSIEVIISKKSRLDYLDLDWRLDKQRRQRQVIKDTKKNLLFPSHSEEKRKI